MKSKQYYISLKAISVMSGFGFAMSFLAVLSQNLDAANKPFSILTIEGSHVVVNDDDQSDQNNPKGNQVKDNLPSERVGNDGLKGVQPTAAAFSDPKLVKFEIKAKYAKDFQCKLTVTTTGQTDKISLWKDAVLEENLKREQFVWQSPYYITSEEDEIITFWVEGLAPTDTFDSISIKADYEVTDLNTSEKATSSSEIQFGVSQVDLQIDSNNDAGFDVTFVDPDDDIEFSGKPEHLGKILLENNGDLDSDGFVDSVDGVGLGVSAKCEPLQLVPLKIKLSNAYDPASAVIQFTYDQSIPRPSGTKNGGDISSSAPYSVTKKGMRLWTVDGHLRTSGQNVAASGGGNFIPAGQPIEWKNILKGPLDTDRERTLFIEYVDVQGGTKSFEKKDIVVSVIDDKSSAKGKITSIKEDATPTETTLTLTSREAPDGVCVALLPVNIVADTNRDGHVVLASDHLGKDAWTNERGAIYIVNFDSDGALKTGENKALADGITWWETEGKPENEDWLINSASDEGDVAPLLIKVPTLPEGSKAYLVASELEDVRSIHLFSRIKSGKKTIWGGYLEEGRPWKKDPANPLSIEITKCLNSSEDGGSAANTQIAEGEYTLGIEGLLFRGMTVPDGTLPSFPGKFSGVIDLELELQVPGSAARQKCGKVRLKVAPFLLARNGLPTPHVYVAAESSSPTNSLLAGMPQEKVVQAGRPDESPWMQDHVEIGYTQRPGMNDPMNITFVCPYRNIDGKNPMLADWPRSELAGVNLGFFSLGKTVGIQSSGNYGGNIELSNTETNHPLGRILAGSKMTAELQAFFIAQEKQKLTTVNVDYAAVKHIDEVISIGPSAIYKADPAAGIALLKEKFNTEISQLEGVFFSKDNKRAKVASVFVTTPDPTGPEDYSRFYVITNLDYDANFDAWKEYKYIRIVNMTEKSSGPANGQVAWISGIEKAVAGDAPGEENVTGKMKIKVNRVCEAPVGSDWAIPGGGQGRTDRWCIPPQKNDSIVAVKDTLFWAGKWVKVDENWVESEPGRPAFITVKEVLSYPKIKTYNTTTLPSLIAASVEAAGIKNPIGLPGIYHESTYQDVKGDDRDSFANAFVPAAINLQWTNEGIAAVAEQFGPRDSENKDVFKEKLLEILGASTVPLDDWDIYHLGFGEVHCGSAAKRTADPAWWIK